MKIGMLGGTFDPIHLGHIMLGKQFAMQLGLDKVLIIPTATPPHKAAAATPPEMRLEMCRLAAEYAGDVFEASDIEQRRQGKSYSFYTLTQLKQEYPGSELFLIVGADMFMTMETWYRFDELKELATFCTVPRDDISADQLGEYALKLDRLGCRSMVTDVVLFPVSSTMVRRAAQKGEPLAGMVPPQVEDYITKHNLYR